jgi:hypothetical protein
VSKKPKPATAGEKMEMKRFGLTMDDVRNSGHKDDARRIDSAILRAVKKERERINRWRDAHRNGLASWVALEEGIKSGKECP